MGSERRRRGDSRDALLAEARELVQRLDALGRRLFLSKRHSRDVIRSIPATELPVRVDFSGHARGQDARARRLIHQLDTHLDDAILQNAAFRPGRVFSFFDDSAEGEACVPPDPRYVFAGYSETGLPLWKSLLDVAIAKGDERIASLAKDVASPIMLVITREELLERRLAEFSRNDHVYDIRGQIVLGYFRLPDTGSVAEKFAVTLQIIRSSTRSGVVRLGVNTIALLPDGEDLNAHVDRREWPLHRLLVAADRRLAAVNQELKNMPRRERRAAAAREAERMLHDMRLGLDRRERRNGWRTGHARQRAEEGDRPTGMARRDVATARFDRVLFDGKDRTYVVLGGKGRVHVFSEDGLHVTSLQLERKAIDHRLQQNRWRPLDRELVRDVLRRARRAFESAANGDGGRTPQSDPEGERSDGPS